METSKIEIFESISLLSKLMPYYGSSHEGFLLLSKLSKSVRDYLFEHYPEYRRFMLKYAKKIKYVYDEHLEMKLPLDLFQFSVLKVYSEETAELLISLIHKLTNKDGLYFGEHYMSDQICFEKIYVWPEYIPTLHPHIESLSSIKVFPFGGEDLSQNHSFLDLIVLYDIFDRKDNKLKACFFIDSELKKINSIYESFKRIEMLLCYKYKNTFAKLNALKQTSIQEIEYVNLWKMNVLEDEHFINQLLNYKINTLKYSGFSCKSISNLALENISKINPQKLYLSSLKSISTVFKIFSHLQEDINVSFSRVNERDPLKFEKTLVLFKTKDDMVKAYCDKIGCNFKENSSQENILFLENYVCISNLERIAIEKFKKDNLSAKIPLEGLSLSDLKVEDCILIPRNNLSCLKLNLSDMSYIFENEINVTNFKSLSLKTRIIIKLSSMDDFAQLIKLKEYFPEHSELEIDYSHNDINKTNIDETLLLSILSKFKLTSLRVRDCDRDKDIFMILLQIPSIQETLEDFSIKRLDIYNCASVVELLVEFKKIKTIEINCDHSFNDDEFEEYRLKIKQYEKKFKKKHSEIEIDICYHTYR